MPEPVHIAAIDAGSNAVRLSISRAYSALDIEPLHTERYPLRLGENVFVRHRFTEDTFKKGVKAFRHLRQLMDEFDVTLYRAVATSALREAANRDLADTRVAIAFRVLGERVAPPAGNPTMRNMTWRSGTRSTGWISTTNPALTPSTSWPLEGRCRGVC